MSMESIRIENMYDLKETIAAEILREDVSVGSASVHQRVYCEAGKYTGSGRV